MPVVNGKKKKKNVYEVKAKDVDAGEFVRLGSGIVMGEIPIDKLQLRRERFRLMNVHQRAALHDSIERLGMRDPIVVVPVKGGGFAIVDGHHRVDEAQSRGLSAIPAIVLTDRKGKTVSRREADLSMFRFNVSADYQGDAFLRVLYEMSEDGTSLKDLAVSTANDLKTIEELVQAYDISLPSAEGKEVNTSDYDEAIPYGAAANDIPTTESSRGVPLLLSLPGGKDTRELLERAREAFGVESYEDAVIQTLRAAFAVTHTGE